MKYVRATYDEFDDDSSLYSVGKPLRDGGEEVLMTRVGSTADVAKLLDLSKEELAELERTGDLHVDIEGRPVWVSVY